MPVINKHEAGQQGQTQAENHLLAKGCKILAKNYRVRTGEIDLIVRDGSYIVFVEVKYRATTTHGSPAEAVGIKKQQKIIRTAMFYITQNKLDNQDFRFDVVEVLGTTVNHIENAFGLN
ncbi:MAG: YraN family protein [Defluviitaleaceae bacterium]|nr:YraN family protein [Defluviitaleaceae bacterium]